MVLVFLKVGALRIGHDNLTGKVGVESRVLLGHLPFERQQPRLFDGVGEDRAESSRQQGEGKFARLTSDLSSGAKLIAQVSKKIGPVRRLDVSLDGLIKDPGAEIDLSKEREGKGEAMGLPAKQI